MAKKTITIRQEADTLLVLYTVPDTWEEADFVATAMDGFENWANIEIETVPKLFGAGSYVVSKRVTELTASISASVRKESVRSLYVAFKVAAAGLEPIGISIKEGSTTESLEAYITGVKWEQFSDEEANLTLSLKITSGETI